MSDQPRALEELSDEELMKMEQAPAPLEGESEGFSEHSPGTFEDELETRSVDPNAEQEDPNGEAAGSIEEDHTTPHQSTPEEDPLEDPEQAASEGEEEAGGETGEILEEPTALEDPEAEPGSEPDPEPQAKAPSEKESKATETSEGEVDYKAAYEQIMAPFKANGRQIQLNSPEDVVRLMQQGANYTKKMQSLKPNLKLMRMLENQQLLDEGKLTFLIDLHRRDPEAIRKYLKDGGVDPLDIDTTTEPAYTPGNHTVSDQEMQFQETLQDMMSTDAGQQTVTMVHKDWDQASKEALYQEPEILRIIDEQRTNGIYDRITSEIERRKLLGTLAPNASFLSTYRQVGDELHAQGQLVLSQPETPATPTPQPQAQVQTPAQPQRVVAQRPTTVRKPAGNNERAKAASPTRTGSKPAAKEFDPFALTDDEIMAMDFPQRA